MKSETPEFDYVIVGAGSAGCVLANRLSADGKNSVLLLEAGPKDTNPWIHVPLGYGKLFKEKTVNWMYQTEPEPGLKGRSVFQPRGKVLGGSSSINGLLYVRGQHEDYDRWRQRGNLAGAMTTSCRISRRRRTSSAAPTISTASAARCRFPIWGIADPLSAAFVAAAAETGIPDNPDFNGATQEGAGFFQTTTRRGRRASTAVAYLRPAKGRSNLHVETSALAQRIVFDGRRAMAVEYRQAGEPANGAGAQGNTGFLRRVQFAAIAAALRRRARRTSCGSMASMSCSMRPGVGNDLQDHLQVRVVMRCYAAHHAQRRRQQPRPQDSGRPAICGVPHWPADDRRRNVGRVLQDQSAPGDTGYPDPLPAVLDRQDGREAASVFRIYARRSASCAPKAAARFASEVPIPRRRRKSGSIISRPRPIAPPMSKA